MMTVICHLVLLMSWLYRQYVLLRCDQVCFGGATIVKDNKLKSLISNNSVTNSVTNVDNFENSIYMKLYNLLILTENKKKSKKQF